MTTKRNLSAGLQTPTQKVRFPTAGFAGWVVFQRIDSEQGRSANPAANGLALGKTSLVYRLLEMAPDGSGTHTRSDHALDPPMTAPSAIRPVTRWSVRFAGGLALLLPALFSLFHSLATGRTQAAVAGPDRPALAFDQYMVNFGEPQPRALHEAQFHFENRSSRPVQITGIKPSCGCLTPLIVGYKDRKRVDNLKEFAPGEHGILAMGIRPAKEQPGDKSYTVEVSYDDGQPRTETVEFRITLPKKKLTVEPNELYFYQLTGEPDSRVVMVRDFRDKPARVLGVEAITAGRKSEAQPLPDVTVTLGELTRGADGESSWPVQVDVGPDLAPGRLDGWLVILTDDPDAPRIKIPILLFGKEQPTAGGKAPRSPLYGPAPRTATEPRESAIK